MPSHPTAPHPTSDPWSQRPPPPPLPPWSTPPSGVPMAAKVVMGMFAFAALSALGVVGCFLLLVFFGPTSSC